MKQKIQINPELTCNKQETEEVHIMLDIISLTHNINMIHYNFNGKKREELKYEILNKDYILKSEYSELISIICTKNNLSSISLQLGTIDMFCKKVDFKDVKNSSHILNMLILVINDIALSDTDKTHLINIYKEHKSNVKNYGLFCGIGLESIRVVYRSLTDVIDKIGYDELKKSLQDRIIRFLKIEIIEEKNDIYGKRLTPTELKDISNMYKYFELVQDVSFIKESIPKYIGPFDKVSTYYVDFLWLKNMIVKDSIPKDILRISQMYGKIIEYDNHYDKFTIITLLDFSFMIFNLYYGELSNVSQYSILNQLSSSRHNLVCNLNECNTGIKHTEQLISNLHNCLTKTINLYTYKVVQKDLHNIFNTTLNLYSKYR